MSISLQRIKELVVDWGHKEIVALEEHLGMHPNREAPKPAPVTDGDNKQTDSIAAGLISQVADLEEKLKTAEAGIGKLKDDNAALAAELKKTTEGTDAKLQAAADAGAAPQPGGTDGQG